MNKKYTGRSFPVIIIMLVIYSFISFSLAAQDNGTGYKLKTVIIDAGHGGKDHHHPVPLLMRLEHPLGHGLDLVRIGHRGAAEFLNYKSHKFTSTQNDIYLNSKIL